MRTGGPARKRGRRPEPQAALPGGVPGPHTCRLPGPWQRRSLEGIALKTIEYYYSLRSSFTYLGAARIADLAAEYGRRLIHKPIFLSVILPPSGALPFDQRPPHRTAYMRRDLERCAARLDMKVELEPVHHLGANELPSGVVVAAQRAIRDGAGDGDLEALSTGILGALWRDDRDIADEAVITGLCQAAGFDPAPLVRAATSPDVQLEIERNNREAIILGVLGSPTYFVDGENFYGQDRLDFVEQALAKS